MPQYGSAITQIVRGEINPLSQAEEKELLGSSMSYYPTDLLVVGWMTAFVYDTDEGAAPIFQLLEYTNSQLLEYRRYDEVLTRVLKRAYDSLGGPRAPWKTCSDPRRQRSRAASVCVYLRPLTGVGGGRGCPSLRHVRHLLAAD